jgi:hypothetical protein
LDYSRVFAPRTKSEASRIPVGETALWASLWAKPRAGVTTFAANTVTCTTKTNLRYEQVMCELGNQCKRVLLDRSRSALQVGHLERIYRDQIGIWNSPHRGCGRLPFPV